jgi:ribokinase
MPSIRRPIGTSRRGRPAASGRTAAPRIVVLGDLVLDVVVSPVRPIEAGTDVPGRVTFVQGGSAANTARWLGWLGAYATLICAVGRDPVGRALVSALRSDRVTVWASRAVGARTARIAVLVGGEGERSFVPDRGAADLLGPDDLRAAWFRGIDVLHLPVYSLLGSPLGEAGLRAIELARAEHAAVSVDLASIGPLMARGRQAAVALVHAAGPDILFATAAETAALVGADRPDDLLAFAPIAVVKRGPRGATVVARVDGERLQFDVATPPVAASDTTGAGDAFDAGFLVGWLTARATGRSVPVALRRAALSGHRAAARQLSTARPELSIG